MEAFLKKAHQVHGDRYNYSKVNYVNAATKVVVTCADHGDFLIRPTCHTNQKQGCALCARSARVDSKECLARLQAVFGDRYQYDKVLYTNLRTPIIIECEMHGSFSRRPGVIFRTGLGCPGCGNEGNGTPWSRGAKKERLCKENFVAKAREVHGDRYAYDKTEYKLALNKVIITCPKHGDFEQTPSMHINNRHGCQKCGGTELMTTRDFIEKALEKNPGRPYDYSPVMYQDSRTPVTIICKIHGPFQVTPSHHLCRGGGCHKCHGNYSRQSIAWLEYVSKTQGIVIQHAENGGEKALTLNGKRYNVDGYCEGTQTVFQYHGALHHGCPKKYNAEDINPLNGKSFGELYRKTLEIEGLIAQSYKLVVMWETDWLAKCKTLGINPAATCSQPDFGRKTAEEKRQYHREWREKNRTKPKRIRKTKEETKQREKEWRENNRAKLQASKKEYYQKHRTKILAQQKQRQAIQGNRGSAA